MGPTTGFLIQLVSCAVKVDEKNDCPTSCGCCLHLSFLSYYFAPVALPPYHSQNTLHSQGLCTCCCPLHRLLLCLRSQPIVTSSERLFLNILSSMSFIPLTPTYLSVPKACFLPSEYVLDPELGVVCLLFSPLRV